MNEHLLRLDKDLQDLVPGFMDSRRRDLQTLRDALDNADFERIARLGHNITGVAGSFGFSHLSRLGRTLERAAGDQDEAAVEDCMERMREHLERLRIEYH